MSWQLGGTKPWVAKAGREMGQRFGIATIYGLGSRSHASDHPLGLALDFMTTKGQPLADYAKANANRLGITYVIWHQHIWSVARASEGWRLMEDRGDPTSNHMDHVHVSFQATAPAGGGSPTVPKGSGGSAPSSPSDGKPAQNRAHTTVSTSSDLGWLGGAVSGPIRDGIVLAGVLFTGVALVGVGLARFTKPARKAATDIGLQVGTLAVPEAKAATMAAGAATATKGAAR